MTRWFGAARVRIGLPLAALALGAAFALRGLEIAPGPTWFYVLAWYPTLVALDLAVYALGGESLLARPRAVAALLFWSTIIWFGFEALNFRLENWYYVFLPANRAERWIGITVSFATVAPAILLPARLLEQLGVWRSLRGAPIAISDRDLRLALVLGAGLLAAVLAWPQRLYPLAWGAVWLVAEPLLYRRDPDRSLFGDLARGDYGRIARLLVAGLLAGILWETYNAGDRGKWVYTVPFLEELKLFEMPLLGFLGFPFFALELWSLYHLVAPRTRLATVLPAAGCAIVVLLGMERYTISSVTPRLDDLPGVSGPVRGRLVAAGLGDIFRVARLPPDSLARRAGLAPGEALAAHEAARLATLRGIGTAHAGRLVAAGVATVPALATADPDSLWRRARDAHRPTAAEVRVWIRAARRATQRPFRVLVWNIHAGKDGQGRDNLERVAALIRSTGADIAVLQEVDRLTARSGGVDQVTELARRTGYHAAFGRTLDFQGGAYGIALLSRWPVWRDTTLALPVAPPQRRAGGGYEPRAVLHAVITAPQGTLHVLDTHLDPSPDDAYRLQEAGTVRRVAARLRGAAPLVVLGGDLNAPPDGPVVARLAVGDWRDPWPECGAGAGLTYPAAGPVKRIDYLLLPSTLVCREAQVLQADASDHRPVLWVVARDAAAP